MATMILKRKTFTKWDETDNLKKMKDSDVLAERRRSNAPTVGGTMNTIGNMALGAGAAGAAGAALGAMSGAKRGVHKMALRAGKFGKIGAGVGLAATALNEMRKSGKKRKENDFYNNRLEYAQRQALRREKKDWKSNMTQRDGYTY